MSDIYERKVEAALDQQPADEENECRKPCDPAVGCPFCADYWQRMVNEGLWDMDRHRWTDKGWASITR